MVTSAQQVIGRRKKLAEMFTVQRVVSCGWWQIRLPAAAETQDCRQRLLQVENGCRGLCQLWAWTTKGHNQSARGMRGKSEGEGKLEARNRWAAIWPPLPSHQPSSRELKTQRDAVAKQPDWEWPDENESVLMEHQSDSTVRIGSPSRKLYKDGGSHTGLRWYAAFTENLDPAARFWGCFCDGFKD